MTIALIDDCPQDLALLSEYVCRYCNEHKIHASVKQFSHEKDFENILDKEHYDLVFLDIFMQDSNGILIAKKLRTCRQGIPPARPGLSFETLY